MSIVNGIIQAPISIADVKTVLGETSNDLATLCRSDKINMWAKYKPVELNKPFTSDEFDFTNNHWRDNATWFKGADFASVGICGIKIAHSNTLQSLTELYDKGLGNWSRVKVGSTFACPYRLSDFIGYKHAATAPFKRPSIMIEGTKNGSITAIMMIKDVSIDYELNIYNIGILAETYFGVALKNESGQIVCFKTSNEPLKSGNASVDIENANLDIGAYKAYAFLSSVPLALNRPPVKAIYYTIHGFSASETKVTSNQYNIEKYYVIQAFETIKGEICVKIKIDKSYPGGSTNNFYVMLRFSSTEMDSPMIKGEQAYNFEHVNPGETYTHFFNGIQTGQRYRLEYIFMGKTDHVPVKMIDLNDNLETT